MSVTYPLEVAGVLATLCNPHCQSDASYLQHKQDLSWQEHTQGVMSQHVKRVQGLLPAYADQPLFGHQPAPMSADATDGKFGALCGNAPKCG